VFKIIKKKSIRKLSRLEKNMKDSDSAASCECASNVRSRTSVDFTVLSSQRRTIKLNRYVLQVIMTVLVNRNQNI